jgi:hypothetical protein
MLILSDAALKIYRASIVQACSSQQSAAQFSCMKPVKYYLKARHRCSTRDHAQLASLARSVMLVGMHLV